MRHLIHAMLAALLSASTALAMAQIAPATSAPAGTTIDTAKAQAANTTWPKPAASDKLEGQRGGADTVNTQATLTGTVADNSARNVVTGNNIIDNGSFANMSGMPMVIQNTGANVLIQNATVINLQMR